MKKINPELKRLRYNQRQREQRLRRQGAEDIDTKPCEICGRTRIVRHRDHDHHTGFDRGVLCQRCNMALGLFDDSISILKNAIQYLSRYQTNDRMRHRRMKRSKAILSKPPAR